MKLFYFLIISFCVFSHGVKSQTPTWQWAKGAGGSLYESINDIVIDHSGNVLVTGYFRSPTITFGTTVLFNNGYADIFIVKYDPLGNVIWAQSAGGAMDDFPTSIVTNEDGGILITGGFFSDSLILGNSALANNSISTIFIVEYDSAGNVNWATSAGGNDYDAISDICVDIDGNLLITGFFSSDTLFFGNTALTNTTLFGSEMFVIKLDSSRSVVWAKTSSGTMGAQMTSIVSDKDGNVIVSGDFLDSIRIDSFTFFANTSIAVAFWDFFIAKYDSSGNLLWIKHGNGVYSDNSRSITCDKDGSILLCGAFQSDTLYIGNTFINQPSTMGYTEIFISKFDSDGNVIWTKTGLADTDDDYCMSIDSDISGNVLVTGFFHSTTIQFDSVIVNNSSTIPYSDIFIAKFDSAGNVIYAFSVGGAISDLGSSIAADSTGAVYVGGSFASQSVNFGATTLMSVQYSDLFVGKLDVVTGLTQVNSANVDLTFYPNPTTGVLNFSSSVVLENITAFNSLGQILHQSNPGSKTALIQLDEPGIYNIRIATAEGFVTKRVVVTN